MANKYLITGPHGFIASKLIQTLGGEKFYGFKEKTRDSISLLHNTIDEIAEFIRHNKINIIYHLATRYERQLTSDNVEDLVNLNYTSSVKLIHACNKVGNIRLVYTTSFYDLDLYDKHYSFYGELKYTTEIHIKNYLSSNNNYTIFRLFDNYGISDRRQKLIPLLINLQRGEKLILNSPYNLIYPVPVNKVLEQLKSSETHRGNQCYDLRPEKPIQLKELVSIFNEFHALKGSVHFQSESTAQQRVKFRFATPENWIVNAADLRCFLANLHHSA